MQVAGYAGKAIKIYMDFQAHKGFAHITASAAVRDYIRYNTRSRMLFLEGLSSVPYSSESLRIQDA